MTGDAGFAARTGHESPASDPDARARQVAQAWESLQQIRHLVQPDHPELPAPWERTRPVQAVGLALERSGVEFAGVDAQGTVVHGGVRLTDESPGVVRVEWVHRRGERPADAGEAHLLEAAAAAGTAGWEALLYRAARSRFLLVEPGRLT